MALVIFHHIPKTAGTSLRHTVLQNYARDRVLEHAEPLPEWARNYWPKWYHALSPPERERLECVIGHFAHFLVPVLLYAGVPFRQLTMLRDPVERCASFYYFCRECAVSDPDVGMGRIGRFILDRGLTLADIYRRFGGGSPDTSEDHVLLHMFFDGQVRSIVQPLVAPAFSFRPTAEERVALRIAEDILDKSYSVGVTEEYDKSLALYADTFGWKARSSVRLRVTASKQQAPPLSAETVELIREHNRLDVALHAKYLARFR